MVPINCPDSNCLIKGRLSQHEVKEILAHNETIVYDYNESLCDNNNNFNPDTKADFEPGEFYEKYLRICQNIGKNSTLIETSINARFKLKVTRH